MKVKEAARVTSPLPIAENSSGFGEESRASHGVEEDATGFEFPLNDA